LMVMMPLILLATMTDISVCPANRQDTSASQPREGAAPTPIRLRHR
jgi:hypothetical protein